MTMLPRLVALAVLAATAPAHAQTAPELLDAAQRLESAANDVRAVDRALDGDVDPDDRAALRDKAEAARSAAASTAAVLQTQLELVDARIAQLGPETAGVAEAADIRAQRRLLAQQRTTIDSAIKRGRLLDVEARQLVDEIAAAQAEQIGAQIATRVASPASPRFWAGLLRAAPRDLARAGRLLADGAAGVRNGLGGGRGWLALLGLAAAIVLLFPARVMLRDSGKRYLIDGAPGHRVRRSGYALWRVAAGTFMPGLAALAFTQGLNWSGLVAPRWAPMLATLVQSSFVAGFVASLGGALLMRGQPSWRLLPIGDDAAQRLRPWTWLLAGLAFVTPLVDGFTRTAGTSAAGRSALEMAEALLHLLLLGGVLLTLGRLRAARSRDPDADAAEPVRAGLAFLTLAAWLVAVVALGAILLGYVGFSLFVARMLAWVTVIAGTLYLLLSATDDLATTIFCGTSRVGEALHRGLGLRRSTIDQFGVLVSGAVRLFLVLLAAGLLLAPFGSGVTSLFDRLSIISQGVTVGEVSISPGAILRALLVFVIGMGAVRLFQGWLTGRYLPTTELDGSARNSVSLVARYAGLVLATLWALASLGIGVERIALLLSALSVGIGFGLQAITQNFVSGLILLAERPVKIGDLVRIGNDEGDVKRISVRSTEIELGDHSTLIVPNSELITKTVLNKTLASPLGRIQLQFSVPIGADAGRVQAMVLDAFHAHPDVLDDPAPSAFIDGLADGRVLFNAFAHVESPRAAYGARSAVLLALLDRFRAEGIDIGTVPQRLELVGDLPRPPDEPRRS